jgi:hypothetical protein
MGDTRFRDYMKWVAEGTVFFLRPHRDLLKEDGVRAGVSWESVLRIDGMIKLLLEMHKVAYLPIESVSMQERVRAVEFTLARSGVQPSARPRDESVATTTGPYDTLRATLGASTPASAGSASAGTIARRVG